jgi:hypothetical protein
VLLWILFFNHIPISKEHFNGIPRILRKVQEESESNQWKRKQNKKWHEDSQG